MASFIGAMSWSTSVKNILKFTMAIWSNYFHTSWTVFVFKGTIVSHFMVILSRDISSIRNGISQISRIKPLHFIASLRILKWINIKNKTIISFLANAGYAFLLYCFCSVSVLSYWGYCLLYYYHQSNIFSMIYFWVSSCVYTIDICIYLHEYISWKNALNFLIASAILIL